MYSIQYSKGQFINAEEISVMDVLNPSGFILFQLRNDDVNFRVDKDYEDSFLNQFKNLDDNNPGNKLTKHNYK